MRNLLIFFFFSPIILSAQNRIGQGAVHELYQKNCATCHGSELQGGLGSTLNDGKFDHGGSDSEIAKNIREGITDMGMPEYGSVLSDNEIRSLVIYIREGELIKKRESSKPVKDATFETEHYSFRLDPVVSINNDAFWAIEDLPGRGLILTEIGGNLRVFENGKLSEPIKNTPKVARSGQGGLLDVLAHPHYEQNGWIYLSFSKPYDESGREKITSVVRGKIVDDEWTDEEVIFELDARFATSAAQHFGSRLVLRDGYLFFSIGDRGKQDLAQDRSTPNGNIFRLHEDGRIPKDNPFIDDESSLAAIWSYGHRNPQGMALHPETDELWAGEHGPRGGDELNLVEKGKNYGWPVITHGMNYNGTPITGITEKEGMEQPKLYWTPSIAPCGMDFYEGDEFPEWKNDLFISGLSSESLTRIRIENNEVVEKEVLFEGFQRVRDVHYSSDGSLYLVLENRGTKESGMYRLVSGK